MGGDDHCGDPDDPGGPLHQQMAPRTGNRHIQQRWVREQSKEHREQH